MKRTEIVAIREYLNITIKRANRDYVKDRGLSEDESDELKKLFRVEARAILDLVNYLGYGENFADLAIKVDQSR